MMTLKEFRAWDKVSNVMIYTPNLMLESAIKDKNAVVMQYTGRKDESKKKIFEGDIIEVTKKIEGNKVTGEVFWNKKKVGFDFKFDFNKFNLIILGELVRKFPLGTLWDNLKIIGNKFENKELLK